MTTNRTNELLQHPAIIELIKQKEHDHYLEYQKGLVKRYSMRNKYIKKGQILFVGSSLMEQFPIEEMQAVLGLDRIIYNRGIGGITTKDLLSLMNVCIFELEPSKIFINIGSNDIGAGLDNGAKEIFLENYKEILLRIKESLPASDLFVMAYYPVNAKENFGLEAENHKELFASRNNKNIALINEEVKMLTVKLGIHYIDVSKGLTDEEGHLKAEYTVEGVHMWPNAYSVILENMKPYL
ncbi:GDSL-type esterase/lipase family protein [Paenibacillus typhae]|uniref:GDSL-type esterase/lipase family protein n=1 Tax=Paenibacillus typhae TaxID=1174501 RepID=UPI001C8DF972|nr:GDSL-type esterase/lipase family protein [Paenibacillus typhae]MBY0014353.1 lysophospholipase [Paenibacillus typhae]